MLNNRFVIGDEQWVLMEPHCLGVASRTVVWLSLEQRRFEFVPVFHGLQGRLAAQG